MRSGRVSIPVQHQERVHRRQRWPQIAQAQHAAGDGEGHVAERLPHPHAVIGRAGLGQGRDICRCPSRTCRHRRSGRPWSCRGRPGIWWRNAPRCRRPIRSAGSGRARPAYCRRSAARPLHGRSPAIASMSVMMPPGIGDAFDEDRLGLRSSIAALEACRDCVASAHFTCQSNLAKPWLNWLIEPP